MLRRTGCAVLFALGLTLTGVQAAAADTLVDNDRTPGSYTRYDGGTDATLQGCSTGRRSQNEPSVAVDPRASDVVVAGSNDYCAEIGSGSGNQWPGYYRSTNGGANWRSSLVPGYPNDTSPLGSAVADEGKLRLRGRSDPGLRRRGSPLLRLHLLQPREAEQRLHLRRPLRRGRRELSLHHARRARHAVGRRAVPGQDQHHGRPAQRQRLRRVGALQRQRRQRRHPLLALHRRRSHLLQAGPHLRRRGLGAVRRPRGGTRRRRLPDLPRLRRLAGSRRDRDREVDERRRLVDAPADRGDDHRVRLDRLRPGHLRGRPVPLPAAQLRAVLEPVGRGR